MTLILRIFIDMKHLITILFLFFTSFLFSQNVFFDYNTSSILHTKSYYDNGQLKEIGFIDEGKRIGEWVFYSKYGIKLAECGFNNLGQKHGEWLVWDGNSQLRAQMFYENGIRKGEWKIYDEHGALTTQRHY